MNSNINDELRQKLDIAGIVDNMVRLLPTKLSEKHDKLVQYIEKFLERINGVNGPDQKKAIRKCQACSFLKTD
jgi:hypothetical protein